MALTGSLNGAWDDGVIQTMTEMRNDVQGMTYTGLDESNLAADQGLEVLADSSPSSPQEGQSWIDTSTPADGAGTAPAVRPRRWDGTAWVGDPIYYATTAPSWTDTGSLWYDQTLELLRIYRRAAEDGAKTGTGILGWHPVDENYQLWLNESGGSVSANRVVISDPASERGFLTTTLHKNMSVIGVTLETIADNASGVIAMASGSACVDIYCDVGPGDVAIGDGICTGPVAGEARTTGPLTTNINVGSATWKLGTPLGAFAVARGTAVIDGLVPCTMLGQVGGGATYRKVSTTIAAEGDALANAQWTGAFDPVDVADYPPGVGGNDFIDNDKHKPIAAVILDVYANQENTTAAVATLTINLSKDGSTIFASATGKGGSTGQFDHSVQAQVVVPTAEDAAPTVMGNVFYWSGTRTTTAGTTAITDAHFNAVGYIY